MIITAWLINLLATSLRLINCLAYFDMVEEVYHLWRLKEEEGDVEDNHESPEKADVAFVPGSFKPPHVGHFNLAEKLSQRSKQSQ